MDTGGASLTAYDQVLYPVGLYPAMHADRLACGSASCAESPKCAFADRQSTAGAAQVHKEPFGGLVPIAVQGIQIREMCHFYLKMNDGDPTSSSTARCLQLAQSFQLFVMQLALGRPFP
jgi:hypothetical protein